MHCHGAVRLAMTADVLGSVPFFPSTVEMAPARNHINVGIIHGIRQPVCFIDPA